MDCQLTSLYESSLNDYPSAGKFYDLLVEFHNHSHLT